MSLTREDEGYPLLVANKYPVQEVVPNSEN